METDKKLAIGMDHSNACVIEFTPHSYELKNIVSESAGRTGASGKKEKALPEKNKQLSDYYKKLAGLIKNYSEVLLFGPNSAKLELFNILSQKKKFEKIKIEIKNTDNMTENQKIFFVKEYFSKL